MGTATGGARLSYTFNMFPAAILVLSGSSPFLSFIILCYIPSHPAVCPLLATLFGTALQNASIVY